MRLLVLIVLFVILFFFPNIVMAVLPNLFSSVRYCAVDLYHYFAHKNYRLQKPLGIIAFVGLFGRGKTLSAVHHVCAIYRAKHGLTVFCPRRKRWVKQVIHIVSNVNLTSVPYEKFVSLEQIVKSTDEIRKFDDEHDTLTCTLILLDEAGAELSHRDFKTNFNPLVLNSILTCRHWNISLFYTAQRFKHVDKVLRDVTSYVLSCEKKWRFQFQKRYDAWELENADNVRNIQCEAILCWFVKDSDYGAYDTFECVDKLKKDLIDGKMMSSDEILALTVGDSSVNMDGVRYSKKYRKSHKRLF